mmetsp:Transcript_1358/g.2879  ORF Transcript_1358/g.2879 Transcript_1358/m.2879 type:complete len:251 (-) Transcript_1358:21-773(-)
MLQSLEKWRLKRPLVAKFLGDVGLRIGVGADPIQPIASELVDPGVLRDAHHEVQHRLSPPVGNKELRRPFAVPQQFREASRERPHELVRFSFLRPRWNATHIAEAAAPVVLLLLCDASWHFPTRSQLPLTVDNFMPDWRGDGADEIVDQMVEVHILCFFHNLLRHAVHPSILCTLVLDEFREALQIREAHCPEFRSDLRLLTSQEILQLEFQNLHCLIQLLLASGYVCLHGRKTAPAAVPLRGLTPAASA